MTDERFDNFPSMAGKIFVKSTDKGFIVQSNDKAMKRCLHGSFYRLREVFIC